MSFTAGIDLSTQSLTVVLYDSNNGKQCFSASVPLEATKPPVSEQIPNSWWIATVEAFSLLRKQNCSLGDISAIGVASQCHGLVPLDRNFQVIRPAKLWNDTQSSGCAKELLKWRPRDWWASTIGLVPNSAHTISKLAWLKENEPASFNVLRYPLLPQDYLNFMLTGKIYTDRSQASGTGYWSAISQSYNHEAIEHVCGSDALEFLIPPMVLPANEVAGRVTTASAQMLGLEPGIPVSVGGGDQHLGALGIGLKPDDIGISLGTSGVVFSLSSKPSVDITGWVDGVCSATGTWLPLVCTLNCTKVTDRFAYYLGVSVKELDILAEKALHKLSLEHIESYFDSSREENMSLSFAAYLDGERSPWSPDARGVIAGISGKTTREEIALVAFMGVVFGLVRAKHHLNQVLDCGGQGRILVCGGGAKSNIYRQLIANCLKQKIYWPKTEDASARGAAIQAAAVAANKEIFEIEAHWQELETTITYPEKWVGNQLYESYLKTCSIAEGIAEEISI